jgi:hypothetical protein
MARMLGRWTSGGCWAGGRSSGRPCLRPGPDCAGWERDTRKRKRQERAMVAAESWREVAVLTGVPVIYEDDPAPFFDEHDLTVIEAIDLVTDL